VLRLQAQAQKRARLMHEQQLARPSSLARVSTNPTGEEVLSPDTPENKGPVVPPTSPSTSNPPPNVMVQAAVSPTIEIPSSSRAPQHQGMMNPVHLHNIEESIGQQTLFAPVRIDTSQVKGKIMQVCLLFLTFMFNYIFKYYRIG
jgi:hypothetical protein